MNSKIMKNVATLNAISNIAGQLVNEDEMFERLSKVTKRMAELKMCDLSSDTVKVILNQEGLLSDEEFEKFLK